MPTEESWNAANQARVGIRNLLAMIGQDPDREGIKETPDRVVRAFVEMTSGYGENPEKILGKLFESDNDEIVLVKGIEFVSLCEHHLLPFIGTATVGYIPDKKVVGLSKIGRLVECFAKRLQLQEQLTTQIAKAVQENIPNLGVGVIIKAKHSCMGCRGVMQPNAEMITCALLGHFRDDPRTRNEFLSLAKG